jgi:hypothetical protein
MKQLLKRIYYFLPVQLFFLHFRKYQLLMVFWLLLLLAITGNIAPHFGAQSLFLAPEYLGKINFISMFFVGSAMCVFAMSWNITTFIVHSRRIPSLGASRNAFVVYCINNSIIPLAYFIFSSIVTVHYQVANEHTPWGTVFFMQAGYYFGFVFVLLLSFSYFFAVSSDLVKLFFAKVTNPSRLRELIPYDALDEEKDTLTAHYFLDERMHLSHVGSKHPLNKRLLDTIMQRQHRNVIFATFVSYVILLILGIYAEQPLLRIPAGAGFLLLFSIFIGFVGAFKYFLRSWATVGWILFAVLLSFLVKYKVLDLRSIAFGLDYSTPAKNQPEYSYAALEHLFTATRYQNDRSREEQRLEHWRHRVMKDSTPPTLVVITASGGGSRSAYWTFRVLQYADSLSGGKLFDHAVMITGASGGMIGATYWRSLHEAYANHKINSPYGPTYQANIGKDILNSIILSLATNDLISPFNTAKVGGYSYFRDRGYAMERELESNTEGIMDHDLLYYKAEEAEGRIPQLIVNSTIVNDGRKLLIGAQPLGYLTRPEYSLTGSTPVIDGVDFCAFFSQQNPLNLRLSSALRMNATFPLVLPVVKLPSRPHINIMDAGLIDNFGTETASRYLFAMRRWINEYAGKVIFLEVRDTRETAVCKIENETGFADMLFEPIFVIQEKWEAFQSNNHTFFKDASPFFLPQKLKYITLQYEPPPKSTAAELNFHLTAREKEEIYRSAQEPRIKEGIDQLIQNIK